MGDSLTNRLPHCSSIARPCPSYTCLLNCCISSLSIERILAIQFPSSLTGEDCICIVGNLLFFTDLGIADNSLFEISIKLKTSPFKDGINSLAISQDQTFYVLPTCLYFVWLACFLELIISLELLFVEVEVGSQCLLFCGTYPSVCKYLFVFIAFFVFNCLFVFVV